MASTLVFVVLFTWLLSKTYRWAACIKEDFATGFTGLTSLSLTIYLDGFTTCWRKSQAERFTEAFCALRQLKQLREFNVVVLEYLGEYSTEICSQQHHDEATHLCRDRATYINSEVKMSEENCRQVHQRSKELMGRWAEEIQEVAMVKGEYAIEYTLLGLSLT